MRNDQGALFAVPQNDAFVILGDLNADPNRGDGQRGAIQQLFRHSRVHPDASIGIRIPRRANIDGEKSVDTAVFGLRVDYILPSTEFRVIDSGICEGKAVDGRYPSDHFLVWMDLELTPLRP